MLSDCSNVDSWTSLTTYCLRQAVLVRRPGETILQALRRLRPVLLQAGLWSQELDEPDSLTKPERVEADARS